MIIRNRACALNRSSDCSVVASRALPRSERISTQVLQLEFNSFWFWYGGFQLLDPETADNGSTDFTPCQ